MTERVTERLDGDKAADLLGRATSSVFAEMAFVDANPADAIPLGDGRRDDAPTRSAVIDVLAPLSCRIELRMTVSLRDRIVDTLFADEPEETRKKSADDALLETLNVIAGEFLSSYFGAGTEIRLSLPRYLCEGETLPGETVAEARLDAEGEPLVATLASVRYRY